MSYSKEQWLEVEREEAEKSDQEMGFPAQRRVKYNIDQDLGIEYADEGPWRSYQFTASGDSLLELVEDAQISEVDQDGGDLRCYGLDEATEKMRELAEKLILEALNAKEKHQLYGKE